jgi:predicted transglutaminase-like protease
VCVVDLVEDSCLQFKLSKVCQTKYSVCCIIFIAVFSADNCFNHHVRIFKSK